MSEPAMTAEDRRRLFDLRCRRKRGGYVSADDMSFLEQMFKTYPHQYEALNDDVHDATLPFGAEHLRRKK